MAIPKLADEQLSSARLAATAARRARADFKNQVRQGSLTFSEALVRAERDDVLAHVKVVDLLRAVPRVGVKRATELMVKYDIADNRRLRGLGRRQIAGLTSEFE